jgi:hypothetical protein
VGSDFGYTFPPYVTLIFTFLFIVSLDLIRKAQKGERETPISAG